MAAPDIDEFEIMRRRIRGQGAQRADQSGRELQRRFAALGNLDSGAALSIQQQNAQAQEDLTSSQEQEVNALQAQTQRAERQAEQDRILQRHGINTQSDTQKYVAQTGAQSAGEIARLSSGTNIELAGIDRKAKAEVENIRAASALELAAKEGDQATALQTLKGTQEQGLQTERIASAEEQAQRDRVHQGQLAYREELLKTRGIDIQEMLAKGQITKDQQEGALNALVTFTDFSSAMKQNGMKPEEMKNILKALPIPGLTPEMVDKIIAMPALTPVAQPQFNPSSSSSLNGSGGSLPPGSKIYRYDPSTGITYYTDADGRSKTAKL